MAKDRVEKGYWGVTKYFAHRHTSLSSGSEVHNTGRQRELVYEFDFDDLPRWLDHLTTRNVRIPDGSIIKEFKFEVTDPFKGDADAQLQFGLMDSNGDILSHTYFGALEGFVGKPRGLQAWFPNTSISFAHHQKACDGENYTLLHICAVGKLTCGEARITIVFEPPFYSYHYDGKALSTQRTGTFMPNRNDCCGEECKQVIMNPCDTERVDAVQVLDCNPVEVKFEDYITEVVKPEPDVTCEGKVIRESSVVRTNDCECSDGSTTITTSGSLSGGSTSSGGCGCGG